MAWDVHISVVFSCTENEPVAALANKHLPTVSVEPDPNSDAPYSREARWFLQDLAERTGTNPGPKGGLSLWGMTGNHTEGREFVNVLRPFWTELLATPDVGPLEFEHIIVFCEPEQSERATAFEISYDEDTGHLDVKEHECPFAWMQM